MALLPPLVLAAHGSPHRAHRPAIEQLRDSIGRAGDTYLGWLDHHQPDLAGAVAAARRREQGLRKDERSVPPTRSSPVVVVPLLLTVGYHARVDVPALLAGQRKVAVSGPLGPDPLLAEAVLRRLREAGAAAGVPVVLAAAGSSDDSVVEQVESVAAGLRTLRSGAVTTGFLSGSGRPLGEAVSAAVAEDPLATVATFLLAPGTLAERVSEQARAAGALRVAEPLSGTPEIIELVRARWVQAAATL